MEGILDILVGARSNDPGGQTGADVFRRASADRVTPERTIGAVALALPASHGAPVASLTPGQDVEILSQGVAGDDRALDVTGRARVTTERTGGACEMDFVGSWDERQGFRVTVGGRRIDVGELARESRHRLLPLLLPRLVEAGPTATTAVAHLALDLAKDVVGAGDAPDDLVIRRGFARILVRLLDDETTPSPTLSDVALELFEAAGSCMERGSSERALAEELVARLMEKAAGVALWSRLAAKLGFAADFAPRTAS